MEKLLKALSIVLITFVCAMSSCSDPVFHSIYEYKNDSGVDIVIVQYNGETIKQTDTVLHGESVKMSYYKRASHMPFPWMSPVKVILNDDRVLTYEIFEEGFKNLFDERNYTEIPTNKENTFIFEYTFTPEHYDMAVPIEEAENSEN